MNPTFRLGTRRVKLPGSRTYRIALGTTFVIGGLFGFLPILGFWMLPIGLLVLSVDFRRVRRFRRRLAVFWLNQWRRWREAA